MWIGGGVAAALGAVIGYLGFRFGLRGFYFVLLTVAFAEICRVVALNVDAVGGALGLYITAMSGQLSMATAAIAGVGGYLAAVLTVKFGWSLLPATCLAAIAGGLVGTTLALLTLKMRDFILKLTTLAFGEALSVLAFNWEYIGGANSFTGIGLKTASGPPRPQP